MIQINKIKITFMFNIHIKSQYFTSQLFFLPKNYINKFLTMAFVFMQKRRLDPIKKPDEDQLFSKMDQNTLFKMEKVMRQQSNEYQFQMIKRKVPRHPLKNFKELSKRSRQNEQIRQRFMKSIENVNNTQKQRKQKLAQLTFNLMRLGHFNNRQKVSVENRTKNLSTNIQNNQLGPGSYQIPNCFKNKTMVKYQIHKMKSPLKKAYRQVLKSLLKQQEQQSSQNQKTIQMASPGPGHYNTKIKQGSPCITKYITKKTATLKFQESQSQQQSEKKTEQTYINVSHKCMPSANFRYNSKGNKTHIASLLNKIMKKPIKDTNLAKINQSKIYQGLYQQNEYQIVREISPGPDQYDTSAKFRQQKNHSNVFISKSVRKICEDSQKWLSNTLPTNFSIQKERNNNMQVLLRKSPIVVKKKKSLPPFNLNCQRFEKQNKVLNQKLQYQSQNSLLKKVNYRSRNYFGSHIDRFKYDLPKLINPSPADYNPNKVSNQKIRNVYFKCDGDRGQVFKANANPGPGDYNTNLDLVNQQTISRAAFNTSEDLKRLDIHQFKKKDTDYGVSNNKLENIVLSSEQVFEKDSFNTENRRKIRQKLPYKNVIPGLIKSKPKQIKKSEKQNKDLPYYNVQRSWENRSFNRNFNQTLFSANNPTQMR